MRILITNDDGINAPGLLTMMAIASEIAGPDGEVWTVAPAFEQSGVSHCISYTRPMMIAQLAERRFAAEGSPADCILAGLHDVMKDNLPDLVLSGVNRGNNAAENTLYSGTIGGALEAALQGLPAIALSQYLGPQTADLDDPFNAAAVHGAATVRAILDNTPPQNGDYRLFHSVNFPPVAAADVKGMKATVQGYRRDVNFSVEPHFAPSGRKFLWVRGGSQHTPTEPGSDVAACLDGYISITPMRADLTAHDDVQTLQGALNT
jgi:5'-nucleotidase